MVLNFNCICFVAKENLSKWVIYGYFPFERNEKKREEFLVLTQSILFIHFVLAPTVKWMMFTIQLMYLNFMLCCMFKYVACIRFYCCVWDSDFMRVSVISHVLYVCLSVTICWKLYYELIAQQIFKYTNWSNQVELINAGSETSVKHIVCACACVSVYSKDDTANNEWTQHLFAQFMIHMNANDWLHRMLEFNDATN